MSYVVGNDYPGLTGEVYEYLIGLNIDALTDYLEANLTAMDDGGTFYLFNDDADSNDLLDLLGDFDIDDSVYGVTWFTYLKSGWSLGGF